MIAVETAVPGKVFAVMTKPAPELDKIGQDLALGPDIAPGEVSA